MWVPGSRIPMPGAQAMCTGNEIFLNTNRCLQEMWKCTDSGAGGTGGANAVDSGEVGKSLGR